MAQCPEERCLTANTPALGIGHLYGIHMLQHQVGAVDTEVQVVVDLRYYRVAAADRVVDKVVVQAA